MEAGRSNQSFESNFDSIFLRHLCDESDVAHWRLAHDGKSTRVWTMVAATSPLPEQQSKNNGLADAAATEPLIQAVKLSANFSDVPAELCYDVLHDPDYRHKVLPIANAYA